MSNVTLDDAKREWCWPFRHDWAKWVKHADYQKSNKIGGNVYELGIVQERHCKVCNMAQRREVKG